jgi:hypothetical protein
MGLLHGTSQCNYKAGVSLEIFVWQCEFHVSDAQMLNRDPQSSLKRPVAVAPLGVPHVNKRKSCREPMLSGAYLWVPEEPYRRSF